MRILRSRGNGASCVHQVEIPRHLSDRKRGLADIKRTQAGPACVLLKVSWFDEGSICGGMCLALLTIRLKEGEDWRMEVAAGGLSSFSYVIAMRQVTIVEGEDSRGYEDDLSKAGGVW